MDNDIWGDHPQSPRAEAEVNPFPRRLDRSKSSPSTQPRVVLDAVLMGNFLDVFLLALLDSPVVSPAFHKEAWEMVTSDHPQVSLAAPRGHAKSTAVTFAYTLAMMLFRVTPYAVVVSNTRAKAIEFVRNLKDALLGNDDIRKHFKVRDFAEKDTEDDFICTLESGYQFRVSSIGFGTSVRGLNWGTKRPGLVICDDMEDDEQVMSQERREKAMTWFLSALLPAMSPTGVVRVVGTILHVDSILQNLINDPGWLSKVWQAHDDRFENILWPERYNKEMLLRIRNNYVQQGRLENYNMEYRNKAVDTSSGYFRDNEFIPMTDTEKLPEERAKRYPYAGGDLAISKKQRRDFTVLPIITVDFRGDWYVELVVRARMDAKEIVDEIFALEAAFAPQCWFVEDGAIYKALRAGLDAEVHEQRRQGKSTMPVIETFTPVDDKMSRARSFQKLMRGKRVHWDTDADWYEDVRQELLEFPRGLHDDVPDAFATLALGVDQMATPSTPEEEEEEDYFHRKRQTTREGGRNPTTGY